MEETGRYYIQEQEDLYQTTEFTKFLWFEIWMVVLVWSFFSSIACVLLSYVGLPISLVEERMQIGDVKGKENDEWADEKFSEQSRRRQKVLHANGKS